MATFQAMTKAPTYKGRPLPNALEGNETSEVAAAKLVGDGDEPALHSARALVARAIAEDRTAMERTTKAIVGNHRAETKHAEQTFDRAHKKALELLVESNVEREALIDRLAAILVAGKAWVDDEHVATRFRSARAEGVEIELKRVLFPPASRPQKGRARP